MEGPSLYSDWENTRRIVKFLKTFHDATSQFSSSLKVTSNLVTFFNFDIKYEV